MAPDLTCHPLDPLQYGLRPEYEDRGLTFTDIALEAWLIPLVAALIGWATNWLAVTLSLRPIHFVGANRWLGWQGVIPRKAERMAHICIDQTLGRLGNLHAVYERLDPELITGQVLSRITPHLDDYIDDVMYELHPVLWDNLPWLMRRRIYRWAEQRLPERVEAMVDDFGQELGDLVDLKALISEELAERPEFMNEVFLEAGEAQFRFVIRAGAVFGGLLGLLVMAGWVLHPTPSVLILGGLVVGFVTNWLALSLIFKPLEEKRILGVPVQGLFLRRQREISHVWARKVATELLTVEKVAHAMVHGSRASRTRAIIQKHLRPLLDQSTVMRVTAQVTVGVSGYTELKRAMNQKALTATDEAFHNKAFNQDRAEVVGGMIEERIAALPPKAFQDILRPAFQEDEIWLMLAGGVAGALAGAVQVLLMASLAG